MNEKHRVIRDQLCNHKVYRAKLKVLRMELDHMKTLLEKELSHDESSIEIIEALALPAQAPRTGGRGSSIGSVTERVALGYEEELNEEPPARYLLRSRISSIESSIIHYEYELEALNRALSALSAVELFIIRALYFEDLPWLKVTELYAVNFGPKNERTLKNYRRVAVDKLYDILKGREINVHI